MDCNAVLRMDPSCDTALYTRAEARLQLDDAAVTCFLPKTPHIEPHVLLSCYACEDATVHVCCAARPFACLKCLAHTSALRLFWSV